jgi:hypothetical protein
MLLPYGLGVLLLHPALWHLWHFPSLQAVEVGDAVGLVCPVELSG